MARAVAEASYWDALPAEHRAALRSCMVDLCNDAEVTIPARVMNPKMAPRLLPAALAEFSLGEGDVDVKVCEREVHITLLSGKPTGGLKP